MKKIALLAALMGLAVSANAAPATTTKTTTTTTTTAPAPAPAASSSAAPFGLPVTAIGYDDGLKHLTARLPLGSDQLDVGVGFKFDNGAAEPFSFGVSGFYLKNTNDWGIVKNYLYGGALIGIRDTPSDKLKLNLYAGFQPEITLLDHFIVSTRFGLDMGITPEFVFATAGLPLSIVSGLNFKVVF